MLNKATEIAITDLLPEAKGHRIVVYAGGPVTIGVRGLVRTKSVPYFRVVTNRSELITLIARGTPPSEFRIYAGYVGWTREQLRSEVQRGLWKVEPAAGSRIFVKAAQSPADSAIPPNPTRPI